MKKFIVILTCISTLLFSKENYEDLEKNATLYMDGDGQDYLLVYGQWYRIDIKYEVWPIRYGD